MAAIGVKLIPARSLRFAGVGASSRAQAGKNSRPKDYRGAPKEANRPAGYWIQEQELCTVTSHAMMVTWNTDVEGDTSIWLGTLPTNLVKTTLARGERYHRAEVEGLEPGRRYWYQVETNGVRGALECFCTLPLPAGKHLFTFGVFSDTHLTEGLSHGDPNEIYFGKLVEASEPLLSQCLADAKARGMDAAVFTGDLTDTASRLQLERLRDAILPQLDEIPYYLALGNHDKYEGKAAGRGLGAKGFEQVLGPEGSCRYHQVKFKGRQLLMLDSARRDSDWGTIPPAELDWLRRTLQGDDSPAFLFLHHTCNGPDVWFGINNFLRFQKTIRPFPQVQGIFSGHMHRGAVTTSRFATGQRPYVELPATVQFPCAYGLVRVYEHGFQYNSYKVSRLDLAERSRRKVLGGLPLSGPLYTWYSFGGLGDRNLTYCDHTLQRSSLFEVGAEAGEEEVVELWEQSQKAGGSSVAAAGPGRWRVVLGRFDCLEVAREHQEYLAARYGRRLDLRPDGWPFPWQPKFNIDFTRNQHWFNIAMLNWARGQGQPCAAPS